MWLSQVQSWEQDPKLEKITKLLWDERRIENPTVEDHRGLRREAEEILGPEENLFRIDWVRNALPCSSLPRVHPFIAPGIENDYLPAAQ